MTDADEISPPGARVHIILIPGFAGFDALGQLEYYAGITPLFRRWKERRVRGNGHAGARAVLRYFDNFPSAAVVTRAERLRNYLAKRIARGEFMRGDVLALVGHSTGGLDIRRLLRNLTEDPEAVIPVDGGEGEAYGVKAGEILHMLKRVVFLSVPQWGTNIADWVRTYALGRALVIAELRAAVAASQLPVVDGIERWLTHRAASLAKTDLLLAIEDSLNEADASQCKGEPSCVASAQEAASQLELWLRHMMTDFRVIDDLSADPSGDPASPAHFDLETRRVEKAVWAEYGIETRSYATIGPRPYRFPHGRPALRWNLLDPSSYPDLAIDGKGSKGADVAYRICYRACAGGPFTYPPDPDFEPRATLLGSSERRHIEIWDNDGIVNTASMLWPDGVETILVEGDHEDIAGHFARVPAFGDCGRRYRAYDLLRSGHEAKFRPDFEKVWHGVFAFCCAGLPEPMKAAAMAGAGRAA